MENVELEFEYLKKFIENDLVSNNIKLIKNNSLKSYETKEIFKYLLNKNKSLLANYFNKTEIFEFLKSNIEYTEKLYEFVKDENLNFILDKSIRKNNIKVVKFLLNKKVKVYYNKSLLLKLLLDNNEFSYISDELLEENTKLEFRYIKKLIEYNLIPKNINLFDFNEKEEFIKYLLIKDKILILKYFDVNDRYNFLINNINYTKELYEFVKKEHLVIILDKAISENRIGIVKFLLSKNILPSDFNKDKLLKLLLENNLYEYIYKDLYKFIDLRNIDYEYLEQLITHSLIPEKINFKSDYQKIDFIEVLLNKNKNLIKKYFNIEYLIVNFTQIENKQELFLIFSIEEKHMLFNKLKTNNISLLIKIYKKEPEYLPKLKQILKNTKDKEIKKLFYKNGIKLSFSEKLFGIKE